VATFAIIPKVRRDFMNAGRAILGMSMEGQDGWNGEPAEEGVDHHKNFVKAWQASNQHKLSRSF